MTATDPSVPRTVLPDVIQLVPIDRGQGHDPRSTYVELFWLPQIGPTTAWLGRRLTALTGVDFGHVYGCTTGTTVLAAPHPAAIGAGALRGALGLGLTNRPLERAFDRLARFNLACWDDSRLRFLVRWPTLTAGQIDRLPPFLRRIHDDGSWARGR